MFPRLTLAALLALACAPATLAERVAPLAPPPAFDPLTVPMAQPAAVPPAPVAAPPVLIIPSQANPLGAGQPDNPLDRAIGSILGGLLTDMQPTFDEMARGLDGVASKYGPILDQLGGLIDDVGNYQMPERLPNGDVLIRRRADAPPPPDLNGALGGLLGQSPAIPADPSAPGPAAPVPVPPAPGDQPPLAGPMPTVPDPGAIDL